MAQKVLKVGSSLAVTIPKKFAEELKWKSGDIVGVKVDQARRRVVYYSPDHTLSKEDTKVAELGFSFIERYRKDLEALARK